MSYIFSRKAWVSQMSQWLMDIDVGCCTAPNFGFSRVFPKETDLVLGNQR